MENLGTYLPENFTSFNFRLQRFYQGFHVYLNIQFKFQEFLD